MALKTAGIMLNGQELDLMHRIVLSREDTRAEADLLFGGAANDMRKRDRSMMEKLFPSMKATVTTAPNLQKAIKDFSESGPREYQVKEASVQDADIHEIAPRTAAFFEKKAYLPEAYRNFPELLKEAVRDAALPTTSPTLTASTKDPAFGKTPVRPKISGGSA